MKAQSVGRALVLLAALGLLPSQALADEIVHFTNGAEMTVRAHTVEQDNSMVKLDLGGNSYIAFPMSMVDKIVSAGQDVFLNPAFHPANQAVAGVPSTGPNLADTSIRGGGAPVGFAPQKGLKGQAGVMLGEVADALPSEYTANSGAMDAVPVRRRAYNPAFPARPGEPPQVIAPPSAPRAPVRLALAPGRPQPSQAQPVPAPPPESGDTPESVPPADPAPEDPPEAP